MTAEAMNGSRCPGCGAKLQSEDPSLPGYVPEEALGKEERVICRRCFRIRHYNDFSAVEVDDGAFLQMLGRIAGTDSLVVHIVDIFDFEGSIIGGLKRFIGGNPVLMVVNKMDLLPKSVNPNRIVNWVRKQAKEHGLKVVDAVLCSAKKNIGFDRVLEAIARTRGNRDVYVVGATNTGKSTLINRLIRDFSDLDEELTTSRYPGTTLDLVKIPLDDGRYIIDTPGVVYPYRYTELVSKRNVQALLPEKPIHPVVYQLKPEQTLFFAGFARFDFAAGEAQSFTCYVSNAIRIHRTKLANADALYAAQAGNLLSPPSREEAEALPEWTVHRFTVRPGERKDIAISGLGWIKVNGLTGAQLAVHLPRGVRVVMRDALI